MSVPDTRGESEDGEGPAGGRAGDTGGADGNDGAGVGDNDVVKLQQLTMEGGWAGHSWHYWGLVTGPGTWQLETVDGELGMVQVAMALVKIAEWQWRWGWRPEWRQGKRRWAHGDCA